MANQDYSSIDRPYGSNMSREGSSQQSSGDTGSDANGSVEQPAVKSEGNMKDLWISSFIKSKNWSSKKRGFYIDGETGHAEFSDVFLKGGLTLTGDIILYDNSTGGGGTVSGDSTQIRFVRTDDTTQEFVMRRRAGKDNDLDNVFELYATEPNATAKNYIFIGRQGTTGDENVNYVDVTANIDTSLSASFSNGSVGLALTGHAALSPSLHILATDARNFVGPSAVGVYTLIFGQGNDGGCGIGFLDDSIIPGPVARVPLYVTSDTESQPRVPPALTGTVTSNINIAGSLIPEADAYDHGYGKYGFSLGNSSHRFKNLYINGVFRRDSYDVPVSYTGRVASGGTISNAPSGWSATNDSAGTYTVTHSFGSSVYEVFIQARAAAAKQTSISTLGTNTFVVKITDTSGTLENNDFSFVVFK